jgi:hypothetical protein
MDSVEFFNKASMCVMDILEASLHGLSSVFRNASPNHQIVNSCLKSRLPISKPTNGKYRIPNSAWQAMSEEERQDALKIMRAFNENRDPSSPGRGGCGRGNRTAQRPKAGKSEAEADIADIT